MSEHPPSPPPHLKFSYIPKSSADVSSVRDLPTFTSADAEYDSAKHGGEDATVVHRKRSLCSAGAIVSLHAQNGLDEALPSDPHPLLVSASMRDDLQPIRVQLRARSPQAKNEGWGGVLRKMKESSFSSSSHSHSLRVWGSVAPSLPLFSLLLPPFLLLFPQHVRHGGPFFFGVVPLYTCGKSASSVQQ